MTASPETFEFDVGETPQPPSPGGPFRFGRRSVIALGVLGLVVLARCHGPHEKPAPAAVPASVEQLDLEGSAAIDTAPEDPAPEEPVEAPQPVVPQAVAPPSDPTAQVAALPAEVAPPPEPVGTPTPPPPTEAVEQALEDTEAVIKTRAVLLARNAKAAEAMANEGIAQNAANEPRQFEKLVSMRDTARALYTLTNRLDSVDVSANPYQAIGLVVDALERIETQNLLRDNERGKLNNVAAMLGELGQSIVDNRDEARYPLARRALEAANRWQGRSDGHGEYEAALAELDQRAVRAIARASAAHEPTDSIAKWAPTGGAAKQALASRN